MTCWFVRCNCGAVKEVTYSNLKTGRVGSCGSYSCPHSGRRLKAEEHCDTAALRQIWNMCRHRALRKHIPFSLTVEECGRLVFLPCNYCGSEPSNVARKDSAVGSRAYSGIDRLDSSMGYELQNLVPCCWICNCMKGTMSVNSFKAHIELLHGRLGSF